LRPTVSAAPAAVSPLASLLRTTMLPAPCAMRRVSAASEGTRIPFASGGDEAEAVGGGLEGRERHDVAAIRGEAGAGVGAGDGEARLGLDRDAARVLGEEEAEDRGRGGEGGGELGVGLGEALQRRDLLRVGTLAGGPGGETLRRGPVGLGEDDVEGDGGGSGVGDLPGEGGDVAPRPGPLAEAAEGLVVDVDHSHAGVAVRAGREALVGIEDEAGDLVHRAEAGELEERDEKDRQEAGEDDGRAPGGGRSSPQHSAPASVPARRLRRALPRGWANDSS
jgi:hypothetical protein